MAGGEDNLSFRHLNTQESQRSHLGHRNLQGQDVFLEAVKLPLDKSPTHCIIAPSSQITPALAPIPAILNSVSLVNFTINQKYQLSYPG